MYQLEKSRAEAKALKAELDKYKSAQPGKGEGERGAAPDHGESAKSAVFGALRHLAH
jgi:hypothetical protein